MLHLINPRLGNLVISVIAFFLGLFAPCLIFFLHMPGILQIPVHGQVRTRPGKRQAQHPSTLPILLLLLLRPSLTLCIHKMSTLGKAFLPCHSLIHPSTRPSDPLIRPGFLERRPETDDPVTSNQPLLCLSLPPPFSF